MLKARIREEWHLLNHIYSSIRRLNSKIPLTLTLSPQAGRGDYPPLPPGRERAGERVACSIQDLPVGITVETWAK
jgi:hypothetical protein